ncbi:MAG: FAD-dependent oxidoreductase [Verrucomicrobiales bacterium]
MTPIPKRVAVVGQGVIGLTCAARLSARGHSVDVFSREEFGETTSMAAGAYWWPHKAYPQERVSRWSKASYDEYARCRSIPGAGVRFEKHFRFCLDPDESAYARHLVEEWEEIDGASHGFPCREAFLVVLPVIDVPVFMSRLKSTVESRGVRFHIQELESPAQLFPDFDMVINCSGVWAYHFVGDKEVFPIGGQAVRVSLPEGLTQSTRIYQKEDKFTLVLPRSNDVILGGTSQERDWNRTPNAEATDVIFKRCAELVPEIAGCEILGSTVGLRPGRKSVRLELELMAGDRPVIHNYGHGGGGYTVAWGCADEVVELAENYFAA